MNTVVPAAERTAGLSDASFHPPTREASAGRLPTGHEWFVLDLWKPPSVNSFTRKLGNKSPAVVKWTRNCDLLLMTGGRRPRLTGPFEAVITWNVEEFGRFDADNRIKPLLDYLQRIELIENDKWCRQLLVNWAAVMLDCRVSVRAWREA